MVVTTEGRGCGPGADAEPRALLGSPQAQGLCGSECGHRHAGPLPRVSQPEQHRPGCAEADPIGSDVTEYRDKALSLRSLPGQHQPALRTQGRQLQAPC